MLIHGFLLKCLDPVLTVVAALSNGNPFVLIERNKRDRFIKFKNGLGDGFYSDHFILFKIYQQWASGEVNEDEMIYINKNVMTRIRSTRRHLIKHLLEVGFIIKGSNSHNENSDCWSLVKACLIAGSYTELAEIYEEKDELRTIYDETILISPCSVLRPEGNDKIQNEQSLAELPSKWILFDEKHQHRNKTLSINNTLVSSTAVVMFAGVQSP